MTWYPLAFLPPQISDNAGKPYVGAVLKAYAAETNTVIPMATGVDGTTIATSFPLNAGGYPVSGGMVIIPHVQQNYKIALYPNQAAADLNSGAVWTYDDVSIAPSTSQSFVQSFSGDGVTTHFTLSEDLGTDENTVMIFADKKFEEYSTNGAFATDTAWTKGAGWTIGGGVATATGAISTALSQSSALPLIEGEAYFVTYVVTQSAGAIVPSLGGNSGTSRNAAGTYKELIIAGSTQLIAFTGAAFTGTVDVVSVHRSAIGHREILRPDEFTLNGINLDFDVAPASGTLNILVFAPSLLFGALGALVDASATSEANAAASAEAAEAARAAIMDDPGYILVAADLLGADTIGIVATNIAAVTTVATNIAAVTTVSTNIANVNTVATNIANVNTVATNIAAVGTLVANMSDINDVADDIANINAVAGNSANINTVAGMSSDISTVIANMGDINTVVTNMTSVINAANNIPKANRTATTDPTVNDDSTQGYSVLSEWMNNATNKAYKLLDAAVGAAVWEQITAGSTGVAAADVSVDTSSFGYLSGGNAQDVFDDIDDKLQALPGAQVTVNPAGFAVLTGNDVQELMQEIDDALDVPAPSGGDITLIKSVILTGAVSSVDFVHGSGGVVFDGTYETYLLIYDQVLGSAGGSLNLRTTANSGSSYDSGGTDYAYTGRARFGGSDDSFGNSNAAQIILDQNLGGSGNAGYQYSGVLRFFNPADTTTASLVSNDSYVGGPSTSSEIHSIGVRAAFAAINGFRIYNSGGNIITGRFKLYGVK